MIGFGFGFRLHRSKDNLADGMEARKNSYRDTVSETSRLDITEDQPCLKKSFESSFR